MGQSKIMVLIAAGWIAAGVALCGQAARTPNPTGQSPLPQTPSPVNSPVQTIAGKTPSFAVASIRMIADRDVVPLTASPIGAQGTSLFTLHEMTLANMIAWSFDVDQDRLSGGPDWLNHQFYDVSARPEGDTGLGYAELKPLMQRLLTERFHLEYHRERQNRKGYALRIAKGGPKLVLNHGVAPHSYIFVGRIDGTDMSITQLAGILGHILGEPVVDRSGLTGNYDIRIEYAPLDGTDSPQPSLFAAIEEQLGLRLERQPVPVETLVIDHADRVPTED